MEIPIDVNGYIKFYDRLNKKNLSLGKATGFKNVDYKTYSDFSKKFYSENSKLIPKRIYYNKKNELFYVQFEFKKKVITLGSFHTLEEAEEQLLDFKIFLIK
jgi:ribosomal protein S18